MHKVYKNVIIGENSKIGDFAIVGIANENSKPKTTIGKNANIRSHTVIYAGNEIGENFHTGHAVNIRENNRIGNNVSIGTRSVIEHDVVIKDNVRIHSAAFIPEFTTLEEDCWIGPEVTITNAKYPRGKDVKSQLKGATIGKNAKIGANATILPNIKIGRNAVVGAGSVVTADVPDNKVAVGNPARVIKDISELKGAPYGK